MQINGWTVLLHPLFASALRQMMADVERDRRAHPDSYRQRRAAKLLAATRRMAFVDIPSDPADPRFRLGDTLGPAYRHWFRGKYVQQYRLFFRFHEKQKIIVLAWVNDEETKRAYESRTDAYRVFSRMLERGRPPDDWAALMAEASKPLPFDERGFASEE